MNWIKVIRNAAFISLIAFVLSSALMLMLNSRVNWGQQGTTVILFFLGSSIVLFLQEHKNSKESVNNKDL
ncbi:MAG: hypothetical protein IT262_11910 [Saprospiraceae bacterium]|nr:hypothetical protein [Saprospiraceae bacterium]